MNVIKKLFDIRPHEWPRFSLFFAAFFIYNVGVSWSSSSVAAIILNELGAEFVAQGLVFFGMTTIVASIIYTAFVDRVPKHLLLVIMTGISAGLVGLVLLALTLGARTFAAVGLFVLSEAILLIWVLQWKTNIIDFYDTRTSKRILPLLGVARLVGLSFGGFSYPFLTEILRLNADQIVLMWFGTLVIVLLIVWVMPRVMKDPPAQWEETDDGYLDSIRDGFAYIKNSSYLQWMAISAILMNAMIALFQFKAGVLVEDYYKQVYADPILREAAIGNFFATIDAYSSLVMLFVQLFIFPRIMDKIGLGNVNLIYPIASIFVAMSLGVASLGLVAPSFYLFIAGSAHIDRKTFRRVFRSPINGLLINAVPSFMKGRSRSVINGIIAPVAVIAIGFTSQIESDVLFAIVVLVIAGGYVVTGFMLKRKYAEAMVQLLESEDYAALLSQDTDLGRADAETVRLLAERIDKAPDDDFKLFIATILAEVGGEEAEPALLERLPHVSDALKSELLRMMIETEVLTPASRSLLVMYSNSENVALRRQTLAGMLHIIASTESAFNRLVDEHLHDPDYVIRLMMAQALAQQSGGKGRERALRVIRASMNDYDVDVRVLATRTLASLGDAQAIEQLVLMMEDDEDEVRYEATSGIDRLWHDDMPLKLKELVYDREVLLLDDPVPRVREAELAVLRHFGDERAHRALIRGLEDPIPEIRKAASEALVSLGKNAIPPLQTLLQQGTNIQQKMALITLVQIQRDKHIAELMATTRDNLLRIYRHHDAINVMQVAQDKPSYAILVAHYTEQNAQLLEEAFWMFEQIMGKQIETIRETIDSDNKRTRMNAVEALESKINPEIARLVAPLFDPEQTSASLSQIYRDHDPNIPKPEDIIAYFSDHTDAWMRVIAASLVGDLGLGNTELIQKIHGMDVTLPKKPVRDMAQTYISTSFLYNTLQKALDDRDADVVTAANSAARQITGRSILQDFLTNKEDKKVLATIERMIYLKQSGFFKSLNVERLKALAQICDEELVKQDETLFKQGDDGGALYIIVRGAIDIGLSDNDGNRVTLATYESGRAFGDMSLFDNSPRSADAIAREDTLMLRLRRDPFLTLMRQYPDLSVHLITELSERLRHANHQIAELNSSVRTNNLT
jgi:HEAT repeat protein